MRCQMYLDKIFSVFFTKSFINCNSYGRETFYLAKISFTTSPAIINPTIEGTNEILPGI